MSVCDWALTALSGGEIERERGLFVGDPVPAEAVELCVFNGGDGYAFIAEFLRLSGVAVGAPGEDGVMADEEEQALRCECAHV